MNWRRTILFVGFSLTVSVVTLIHRFGENSPIIDCVIGLEEG